MLKGIQSGLVPIKLPHSLSGMIYIYGRTGSGKSVLLRNISEYYLDNFNYKIIDLYGGKRHEGVYCCFPNFFKDDKQIWENLSMNRKLTNPFSKQYKVNINEF